MSLTVTQGCAGRLCSLHQGAAVACRGKCTPHFFRVGRWEEKAAEISADHLCWSPAFVHARGLPAHWPWKARLLPVGSQL